jgi:hypothetical protein
VRVKIAKKNYKKKLIVVYLLKFFAFFTYKTRFFLNKEKFVIFKRLMAYVFQKFDVHAYFPFTKGGKSAIPKLILAGNYFFL